MKELKRCVVALYVVLIVVGLLWQGACSTTDKAKVETAYDTAVVSKTSYDVAFTALAALWAQGFITDEQRDEAIKYGRAYKSAHNAMVEALAVYVENKDNEKSRDAYLAAAEEASISLAETLNYVNRLIVKKGGK